MTAVGDHRAARVDVRFVAKSIEGRVVVDIVRTILQTAIAAGAAPHEYLVDVMSASPEDVQVRPERYTTAAWVKRRLLAEEAASRAQAEAPSAAARVELEHLV